ncbi:MAG: sulfatase-like hydrolase/transferase [Planctomycetota bacterium]
MNRPNVLLIYTDQQRWDTVAALGNRLVGHVVDQVGRILKTLDDTGQRDNTLVVFTSDHGELLGDRGRTGKGPAFDGSSRVPLVMRLPGVIEPGRVHTDIVEAVDIVPTILELCAVQVPPTMQGRSLVPYLAGRECSGRDSAFIEMKNPFGYAFKAVRMTDCLYVVDNNDNEQLYDLADNPGQVVDRSDAPTRRDMLNRARCELIRRWFDVQAQTPRRTAPY